MEVVNRAARTLGHAQATRGDPLRMAWVLGHSAVRYFEPGGLYHVPGERFWQLYEQHAASTDAELIAWTAAEALVFTDDPNEVMARGIERPWSIERMQQRAAEGLAGTSPIPRP